MSYRQTFLYAVFFALCFCRDKEQLWLKSQKNIPPNVWTLIVFNIWDVLLEQFKRWLGQLCHMDLDIFIIDIESFYMHDISFYSYHLFLQCELFNINACSDNAFAAEVKCCVTYL